MTLASSDSINEKPNVIFKSRALTDAILAIHTPTKHVRIDWALANNLLLAWNEYNAAVIANSPEIDQLKAAQQEIKQLKEILTDIASECDECLDKEAALRMVVTARKALQQGS